MSGLTESGAEQGQSYMRGTDEKQVRKANKRRESEEREAEGKAQEPARLSVGHHHHHHCTWALAWPALGDN